MSTGHGAAAAAGCQRHNAGADFCQCAAMKHDAPKIKKMLKYDLLKFAFWRY